MLFVYHGTPFSALSSDFSLSLLNNNTSSLLISNSVCRLIQIKLDSHCIKHFKKKTKGAQDVYEKQFPQCQAV